MNKSEWHEQNKEKLRAYGAEYRAKNRERLQEYDRAKYPERREKKIAQAKNYYAKNRDRARENQLRRQYGIGLEDYKRMLLEQDGRCAICRTDTPKGRGRFHVDHCHRTGRIRGLLCTRCNTLIGRGQDNPATFLAAAQYLTVWAPLV